MSINNKTNCKPTLFPTNSRSMSVHDIGSFNKDMFDPYITLKLRDKLGVVELQKEVRSIYFNLGGNLPDSGILFDETIGTPICKKLACRSNAITKAFHDILNIYINNVLKLSRNMRYEEAEKIAYINAHRTFSDRMAVIDIENRMPY